MGCLWLIDVIAAIDDHTRAHLVGLHAVAIELHLVLPAVAGGTALAATGLQGWTNWNSATGKDLAASA